MAENKEILTLEKFHEALHKDTDKPVKDFREEWNQAHRRHIKVHTGAHRAVWASPFKVTIHSVFPPQQKNKTPIK